MQPRPPCPAFLRRGMSLTTSTARRSPPPARAAWQLSTRTAISRGSTLAGREAMRRSVHSEIDAIEPREWNALGGTQIPFLRHEFLAALEHTGCVGARTGWEPRYFTLHDARGLAAALPAFVKTHSYGEFVFD